MRVSDSEGTFQGNYVVKVFTQKQIIQNNSTIKELVFNVLSQEIEMIFVPIPALVYVSEDIINELIKEHHYKDIKEGWFFASLLIEDISTIDIEQVPIEIQEIVFAWDILLMNYDRREEKHNCFIKDSDIYLIDHELSLKIDNDFEFYTKNNYWEGIAKGNNLEGRCHIFYKSLKNNSHVNFNTFSESFKVLSFKKLEHTKKILEGLGFDVSIIDTILNYLQDAKANQSFFINKLKHILQ
jgi:hypothetical protein